MGDWAFIAGDADIQLCFFAPPTKGTQHLQVSTTSEASPGVLLAGNRLQCAQEQEICAEQQPRAPSYGEGERCSVSIDKFVCLQ